ncbi:MAG TPA: type II CAAX endopeptidase family protein [Clostridia bacterium]|nr:type II CAAX endopeptidase family protein [Clostridia bacterium]
MKRMTISNVNLLYLFMAVLLITIGSIIQSINAELGLIATEFLLVLMPAVIFAIWTRAGMKKIFRLNPLPFREGILIVLIAIIFYPVSIMGNLIVINLLDSIGWYRPIPFPTASNMQEYALLIFAVAVSAGICEEFLFRGVIMKAYEHYGPKRAILSTAVLFGIFHFNLQNLLSPIMLGALFGYYVYITDSIYSGILAHSFHNALSVTIGFLTSMAQNKSSGAEIADTASTSGPVMQYLSIVVFISGCLIVAWILIKRLKKLSAKRLQIYPSKPDDETGVGFAREEVDPVRWWRFIPIAVTGAIYVLFEIAVLSSWR